MEIKILGKDNNNNIALIALVASVFTLFQTSFIRGWVDLVINGTIAYYLWLSPAAIKAFK